MIRGTGNWKNGMQGRKKITSASSVASGNSSDNLRDLQPARGNSPGREDQELNFILLSRYIFRRILACGNAKGETNKCHYLDEIQHYS